MDYIEEIKAALDKNCDCQLQEQIYDVLKYHLIKHKIEPGEKLVAYQIASDIGVSISPVRVALRKLEQLGFVSMKQNSSATVIRYTMDDVKNIYYFRTTLEILAAETACQIMTEEQHKRLLELADEVALAVLLSKSKNISRALEVERADMAFHSYIVECADNPYLTKTHRDLLPQIFYVRQFINNKLTNAAFADEHHLICNALRSGNPRLCSALIDHHLNFSTIVELM